MSNRCDICGKGIQFGHRISHAHNLSKRKWRPNIRRVKTMIKGRVKTVNVCTKCFRRIQKVV